MKRFWAFYGLLPVLLLSLSIVFSIAASTAAAPGILPESESVVFATSTTAVNPNVVFNLVNAEREKNGLSPLIANSKLGKLASARADDIVTREYYAHRNPDGKYYYDYFNDFDIRSGYSCENLDMVFVPNEAEVINEWMASLKGHRGCLLNSQVTDAGFAAAKMNIIYASDVSTEAYIIVGLHSRLLP